MLCFTVSEQVYYSSEWTLSSNNTDTPMLARDSEAKEQLFKSKYKYKQAKESPNNKVCCDLPHRRTKTQRLKRFTKKTTLLFEFLQVQTDMKTLPNSECHFPENSCIRPRPLDLSD